MSQRQRHLKSLALLGWIAIVAAGCGPAELPRMAVNGLVTLDGRPVEQGTISFVPAAGARIPSAGGEIVAGEYSIPAATGPAVSGKYRVEIRWSRPTGKQIELGSPAPPGTMVDEVEEAIPAKFNSQSTLEQEIQPGRSEIHFELTS